LQVLEKATGQAHSAPRGHGLGHLLLAKLIIIRAFLAVVHALDKSFAHLLQELGQEDPLHLGAHPGQVLTLGGRVLGIILQGIEGAQAGAAKGPGGQARKGGQAVHSLLLR
jgi:hypothetical protein